MWKHRSQDRRSRAMTPSTPKVISNSPANFSPTGRQHRSKKSPCSTTGLSPGPDHDVDRRRQRPQPGSRVSTGSGRPAIPGTPAAAALKTTSSTSHVSPEPKESLKPEYIDPRPRHPKEGISEVFIILINSSFSDRLADSTRRASSAAGVVDSARRLPSSGRVVKSARRLPSSGRVVDSARRRSLVCSDPRFLRLRTRYDACTRDLHLICFYDSHCVPDGGGITVMRSSVRGRSGLAPVSPRNMLPSRAV